MSVGYQYYCDGPDPDTPEKRCMSTTHAPIATPPPYLPIGVIETRQVDSAGESVHHFCSWQCAMKFGADQPIPERIEWDGLHQPGENE